MAITEQVLRDAQAAREQRMRSGGVFYVVRGEQIWRAGSDNYYVGRELAVAYDRASSVLLKHGPPEHVREWFLNAQARLKPYLEADGISIDLVMVVFDASVGVDWLNNAIACSGTIVQRVQEAAARQVMA